MDVKVGVLGDAWGSVAVCREQYWHFRVPRTRVCRLRADAGLYTQLEVVMRTQADIFHFIFIKLAARREAVIVFRKNLKFPA